MSSLGPHWDEAYSTKGEEGQSWYQAEPATSLELLRRLGAGPGSRVVDIGGGASRLVDGLLEMGVGAVTVLDLSAAALQLARARVGDGPQVSWVVDDIRTWVPTTTFDLWHDRAALHFLTEPTEQDAYFALLHRTIPSGGVVLGTFAPDGPESCSGLPVARWSAEQLEARLDGFEIVDARREVHVTPWGTEQPFTVVAARRP